MNPAYLPPQASSYPPPPNISPPRSGSANVGGMNPSNFPGSAQNGPATINTPIPTNTTTSSSTNHGGPPSAPLGHQFASGQGPLNQFPHGNMPTQPTLGTSQGLKSGPPQSVSPPFLGGQPTQPGPPLSGVKPNQPFMPGPPNQFGDGNGQSVPGGPPFPPGQKSMQVQPNHPESTNIVNPQQRVPPMTGHMPPFPGQNSLGHNQLPPMHGQNQLLPMPGQNSLGQNQLPPMPNQNTQGNNQLPPVSGHNHSVLGSGPMPPMSGGHNSMAPGHLPPGQNKISQLPGQVPTMQAHHPPMPGQGPLGPNKVPLGPGQLPPLQGHMAGMQGHLPPVPTSTYTGQLPPGPGHMPPPLAGQMPPMPGQLPPKQGQGYPGPGQFTGQVPPIGGQVNGANQLQNQMQGMSLNGPRAGPHMPPPVNQPGYGPQAQPWQPPAPGYQPMPPQPNSGYAQPGYPQAAQQQKRLDPDQMPSPIQVIQDDQRNRSGPFVTNQKGLVPPLVTTDFVVQDQGNTSPRYIRSSMYNVPISQDIMKQTAVPFSLVISPMARLAKDEYSPPIVNFGELGPVRCIRCKAYMCPYMQFIDSGRRFQCLFCKATTDVPAEYFQHLDHTGQRMDKYERPELVLGTYEFVATADYCRNNTLPKPPAVIFIIDVSYNTVKSGLVHLLCSQIKEIIKNLPIDEGQEKSNMRVGFITYNSSVHFYNIKGTLAAPQMIVVGDTQEMFMPLLDGFLCTPEESEAVIDSLMEQIPIMFADTKETEIVLLPAILAGLEALKASECAGKLMVFHSTLPTADAPGRLKNRDDRKLLGTDKERTVLTPQNQAYNQLGQDCVAAGCSVDLFIFNNSYIDISTISQVSRLTGGEVYKYTYFQADIDGDRLIADLMMNISRPIAFDGIMRVRTSTGIRPTDFYGYFYMSNTTDMELAAIDCDKGVAVEIKHDDKLSEEEGVYIQAALLYTSCSGQRRLRILNLALKTCSQMADLYRSCDLDTMINFLSKQATFKLLDNSPKAVKDSIVNRAAQILATYRKNCATPSSAGQLILPECMKLLPLYVNCLLKSDAISGGSDMTLDDRAFAMQVVLMMDVSTSVNYFYPRLVPVHEIDTSEDPVKIPPPVRCTIDKMSEQGVYLLENGIHMFLWVGLGASPEFVQNVFGAPSAIQIDIERPYLPELDNPLSIAVRNIIEEIRIERHRCMRLTIVRQREKLEPVFKHFLVEDRGTDGSASYVDFLCHMHKEIRTLLS